MKTKYLIESYFLLFIIRKKINKVFAYCFLDTLNFNNNKVYNPHIIFSLIKISEYLNDNSILNKINFNNLKFNNYNFSDKIELYVNLLLLSKKYKKKKEHINIIPPPINHKFKTKDPYIIGVLLENVFKLEKLKKHNVSGELLDICLHNLHLFKYNKYTIKKNVHKYFKLIIALEKINDLSFMYKNNEFKNKQNKFKVYRLVNKYIYLRNSVLDNFVNISWRYTKTKYINEILVNLM